MGQRLLPLVVLLLFAASPLLAADPPADSVAKRSAAETAPVDYLRDIKPLFEHKCYACHGAIKQESNLRLDRAAFAKQGGENGPAFIPGDPAESLIVWKLTGENFESRMPPEGEGEALTAEQIALVKAWIAQGGKAPADEKPQTNPKDHWAYQKPVRPDVPAVKNAEWAQTPIDAFIAATHEREGLVPAPPAAPEVLLRRVHLDLVGVPPTRAELHAFLADPSDAHYGRIVDRLLASPQYGERWGRHWMDVWRYSDWSGEFDNQVRGAPRGMWHWRDWIIESVNADKGYDRMTVEMLAGDEIAADDPDTVRATAFLARNFYRFNRNVWLSDAVEHTSQAFLGISMGCCKCHDHKFDPVPQLDYYRLRAFFEPHQVRTDAGGVLVRGSEPEGIPRVFDRDLSQPTYLFFRGNELEPVKDDPLAALTPGVLGEAPTIEPVELPLAAFYPALAAYLDEPDRAANEATAEIASARAALAEATAAHDAARAEFEALADDDRQQQQHRLDEAALQLAVAEARVAAAEEMAPSLSARIAAEKAKYGLAPGADAERLAREAARADRAAVLAEAERDVARSRFETTVAKRTGKGHAAAKKKLDEAEQRLASLRQSSAIDSQPSTIDARPSTAYRPLGQIHPRASSGRRLALANWIANEENPLTARVAVNHIWLRHMGAPLVDDVGDFGLRATEPKFGGLLDWLAVELTENDWRTKHVHRLIVTSTAYRMSSVTRAAPPRNVERDQDNRLLWRMNSRRAESEVIRDSVLAVAGNLDTTMGGPEIPLDQGETSRRRSVYFRHAHERMVPFLDLFDAASVIECYRRKTSVVPQQALALSNSPLPFEQSRLLARQLSEEAARSDDPEATFVRIAFEQVLIRGPSDEEMDRCRAFLAEQSRLLADESRLAEVEGGPDVRVPPSEDPALRARENLVHVLMNHNDFVTIR
ncbi:MAG: PSD1 and planctomycete cytochrome C domain-containing protein [Planctomycetales bacterium]